MKYLPIPFLIVSIIFVSFSFFNVSKLKNDQGDYPKLEKLSDIEMIDSQLKVVFASLKEVSSLSFGESPAADELSVAVFDRQQVKFRNELDVAKEQTQELIEMLKKEVEYRKILEVRIVELSNAGSSVNYSLLIAFMSLLVSVVAMLPSWIQLFRL